MDFQKKFVVKPGAKVKLGDIDPDIGEHESYQSGTAEIARHAASLALLNINSTPKTRVRCLLSCKVSMRQAKTASYVTSSAARTHKGSM